MPNVVYAVIFFVAMASLYCLGYYFNHRTPKPKGCENLKEQCDGCNITSCLNNPVHEKVEENEND